jgi:hypothetical protein
MHNSCRISARGSQTQQSGTSISTSQSHVPEGVVYVLQQVVLAVALASGLACRIDFEVSENLRKGLGPVSFQRTSWPFHRR